MRRGASIGKRRERENEESGQSQKRAPGGLRGEGLVVANEHRTYPSTKVARLAVCGRRTGSGRYTNRKVLEAQGATVPVGSELEGSERYRRKVGECPADTRSAAPSPEAPGCAASCGRPRVLSSAPHAAWVGSWLSGVKKVRRWQRDIGGAGQRRDHSPTGGALKAREPGGGIPSRPSFRRPARQECFAQKEPSGRGSHQARRGVTGRALRAGRVAWNSGCARSCRSFAF